MIIIKDGKVMSLNDEEPDEAFETDDDALARWVETHRAEIDAQINAVVYQHDGNGGRGTIPYPAPVYDDDERSTWVQNDEYLYQWARSEGVSP